MRPYQHPAGTAPTASLTSRPFPHISTYDLTPTGPTTSRLTICARGKWTATFLPRWAAKLWIFWILSTTKIDLHHELKALKHWLNHQP